MENTAPLTFQLERLPTPLGEMLIATDEQGRLRIIDWDDRQDDMHGLLRRQYPGRVVTLRETGQGSPARGCLQAYFEGDIVGIDALEVTTGGTPFQREVWAALRGIPGAHTISYLELANRIGRPAAVRAVGMANGANPVSIVVPCHRVIGSNATLTGYGGGLWRKRWLLDHEQAMLGSLPGQAVLPGF